jgi:hypothetical protein
MASRQKMAKGKKSCIIYFELDRKREWLNHIDGLIMKCYSVDASAEYFSNAISSILYQKDLVL